MGEDVFAEEPEIIGNNTIGVTTMKRKFRQSSHRFQTTGPSTTGRAERFKGSHKVEGAQPCIAFKYPDLFSSVAAGGGAYQVEMQIAENTGVEYDTRRDSPEWLDFGVGNDAIHSRRAREFR